MSDAFLKDKEVKVRKVHNCIWCSQSIIKGEKAQYRVYRFDGEFQADYMHPECYNAMKETDWSYTDEMDGLPDAGMHDRGEPIDWETY